MDLDRNRLEQLPLSQRKEAEAALERLRALVVANPLFAYNHPQISARPVHTKQMLFHAMHSQVKAFFGGNQSGKTTAGIVDDLIQALNLEDIPPHLRKFKKYDPPFFCRIMTPDLGQTLQMVLHQKLRELMPKGVLLGGSWEKAYDVQLRTLRFENGSVFQFMSYDQDLSKMGGATLHRVHYDEEPPLAIRQESKIRTVKYDGDEIFTMTPLQGLTHTYESVWKRRSEDNIGVVTVDMDDNPYLDAKSKARVLEDYPPELLDARKRGIFVHLSGMIFGEFDRERHVVQKTLSPQEMGEANVNIVVSIDPGLRYRAAVLWGALDIHDNLFIFDEIYAQGLNVGQVCEQIKKINAYHDIQPLYYVIDPAARNKLHQTGRSDQMEFADHGIVTIPGQNAVEAGINRVKERLSSEPPKLMIYDGCRHTIDEFTKYRWKDEPRTGQDGRPEPVKKEDHAMDALRYLVMSRPYLPKEEQDEQKPYLQRIMEEDQKKFDRPRVMSEFGGIYN